MSAAALPFYDQFLAQGLSDADARKAAEAAAEQRDADARLRNLDAQVEKAQAEKAQARAEKAAAEAKAHANQAAAEKAQTEQVAAKTATRVVDKAIARNDEQAKAQFVKKDDFHAALRALPTREEMSAGFAQVHARMDRMDARMDRMDANFRIVIAIGVAIFVAVVAQFFRGG